MELVLERCTIRPWRLDDAESLARHANNRKIWLAVRDLFPHPYTIQDAHEFLQRTIPHPHACLKKPGSLSKDASRTTSSKMGSFSIPLLYARTK